MSEGEKIRESSEPNETSLGSFDSLILFFL
jgi:hypothetical protein